VAAALPTTQFSEGVLCRLRDRERIPDPIQAAFALHECDANNIEATRIVESLPLQIVGSRTNQPFSFGSGYRFGRAAIALTTAEADFHEYDIRTIAHDEVQFAASALEITLQ
jgi:hypothetical protein